MSKDTHQNIFIELDALLDTRLGTLWQMNPEAAEELLYLNYHKRMLDNFALLHPAFDQADYEILYAKRDVELLKECRATNMIYIINEVSNDLEAEALTSPHVDGVELTINIYPYELNESEKETLKDMVLTIVGPMTGINIISHPLSALTMRVIKDTYSLVILYHFRDWLVQLNEKDLTSNKCPRIKIMAPVLYEDKIPNEKDLIDPECGYINPFGAMELQFLPYFSLIYTDIRFFSIVEPA